MFNTDHIVKLEHEFQNAAHIHPVDFARNLVGPELLGNFGGADALERTCNTLKYHKAIDGGYPLVTPATGLFNPRDHRPEDLATTFQEIAVRRWYFGSRPSLPSVAMSLLKIRGIDISTMDHDATVNDQERALAKAIMLIALRAEYVKGDPRDLESWIVANPYHNSAHSANVALMGAYVRQIGDVSPLKDSIFKFSREQQLAGIATDLGHDTDHPGTGNPAGDKYFNERVTSDVNRPLLEYCGVAPETINLIDAMTLGTSPDGPSDAVRDVGLDFQRRYEYQEKFPDIAMLFDDPVKTQMAGGTTAGDLYGSSACCLDTSRVMAKLLTREAARAGSDMDLETNPARLYFLEKMVGKQGSVNARQVFEPITRALIGITYAEDYLDECFKNRTGEKFVRPPYHAPLTPDLPDPGQKAA